MSSRDFVIIATLGASDLQVVCDHPRRGRLRLRLKRGCERAFHEDCLAAAFPVRVLPLEETEAVKPYYDQDLRYDPELKCLYIDSAYEENKDFELNAAEGLTLCAPLLADFWQGVSALNTLGRPLHLLLLNTARTRGKFYDQEAVATARLVQPALAAAFQQPDLPLSECLFLQGEESLYLEDGFGQHQLHPAAAQRIDEAVSKLAREHPDSLTLVSDIGGIPEVKPVLAASCRYRFGGKFRSVRRPEKYAGQQPRDMVPPAESLLTRMHAAKLVRGGAIEAAARLAAADDAALQLEPWRRRLMLLARMLNGDRSEIQAEIKEDNSPLAREIRCLASLHTATLLALRVEAALRRQDWPAAIIQTVTFYDAVRTSLIGKFLSKKAKKPCLDVSGFLKVENLAPAAARALPKSAGREIDLRNKKGKRQLDQLLEKFSQKDWMKALGNLESAVQPLRKFRNRAAHTLLSSDDVRQAKEASEKTNLWRLTGEGLRFLDSAPVTGALDLLESQQAAGLYPRLIQAIEADMDQYSFLGSDA